MSLQEFLKNQPEDTLESIAVKYNTTVIDVIRQLPSHVLTTGDHFDEVWNNVADWGEVLLLVHTDDIIAEFTGKLPSGFHRHDYFNLRGKKGISGHIKTKNCAHIALIERQFMGVDTASVLFLNNAGNVMFKIFVGRDEHRKLLSGQLSTFRSLADDFASDC
ncbi:MAG: heme utilization cystosolic carrier protein HutX [Pantoea sp.]|uniref:heme utilization cystosolic carrier protein HutX n=1 Tax=Pantoea sp. TaxID=69393 RepID=UPI0039E6CC1F